MATVHTPVAGYTGQVVGVTFVDGVGVTSDPAALAYFSRHGYHLDPDGPETAGEPAKPARKKPTTNRRKKATG